MAAVRSAATTPASETADAEPATTPDTPAATPETPATPTTDAAQTTKLKRLAVKLKQTVAARDAEVREIRSETLCYRVLRYLPITVAN